jgi:flap endonuclease-1
MSVDLSKLVSKRKIGLEELNGKIIAIDAFNVLYQFLSIIRQPDGSPLVDSHGNVTSHLSGLFYRSVELISYGIKPVYVFDGIPSILKQKTIQARMARRAQALEAWKSAKEKGEIEQAKMHAQASTRINKEIIESAKKLLELMGIPHINAPGEGEAQASLMCSEGLAYAVGSQDYDTMLFGAPLVIRNLTLSGKRKLPRKDIYVTVEPEAMDLEGTLKMNSINREQLIWIGIMLGTDFNSGAPGVGPKTALKLATAAKSLNDIKDILKTKYSFEFELDVSEVENLFLNPEAKKITPEEMERMMKEKMHKPELIDFMCNKHDFGNERIEKFADKLEVIKSAPRQQGIGNWIS